MKVLFVDISLIHLNPTATYLPFLAKDSSDYLDLYGPGYTPANTLEKGVLHWIEQNGPYDFVFLGSSVPIFSSSSEDFSLSLRYIQAFTFTTSPASEILSFFRDVLSSLPHLKGQKLVLSCLNYDYYAASQSHVDKVHDLGLYVLGANDQFISKTGELGPELESEKHYQRKKSIINNCWHQFVSSNPERVITALHFVLPHEFCFKPLRYRGNSIGIPGVNYKLRKDAIRVLNSSPLTVDTKWHFYIYKYLHKLGIPVFSTERGIGLYQYFFRRSLARSKYIFTARGGFGFPVRKFFEIPASGSLLLSTECTGYADLGFTNGRDYISTPPKELVNVLNSLPSPADCAAMALSAQRNALRNHSLAARASQINMCLRSISEGTYNGARWANGTFVLNPKLQCAD